MSYLELDVLEVLVNSIDKQLASVTHVERLLDLQENDP